jgi:molybdopterin-guanine dinucleotide biosynthesis protein A
MSQAVNENPTIEEQTALYGKGRRVIDQVSAETALMQRQANSRLTATLTTLLHRLRRYVEVVPMMEDDKLPEHDVVWMSYPGDGSFEDNPAQAILQALKEHPELWAQAIPDDCCIVPRAHLKVLAGELATESMMLQGASLIEGHASREMAKRK